MNKALAYQLGGDRAPDGKHDLLETKKVNRELLLRGQLKPTLAEFDAIVIDTPPAMRAATVNAFVVADQGSNKKSDRDFEMVGLTRFSH